MDESERLQRFRDRIGYAEDRELADEHDNETAERICALLNHEGIDKHCMVDAYYYDFSVIPRDVQQKLQLWRDAYLIFGITVNGQIVSKWVDRWALDSSHPIVNGEVQEKPYEKNERIPEIKQSFNKDLLSHPVPDLGFFKKHK